MTVSVLRGATTQWNGYTLISIAFLRRQSSISIPDLPRQCLWGESRSIRLIRAALKSSREAKALRAKSMAKMSRGAGIDPDHDFCRRAA